MSRLEAAFPRGLFPQAAAAVMAPLAAGNAAVPQALPD